MIHFGMESRLYKYSNMLYNLMKINLLVLIFSFSIVGFGSAIATGFYEMNQFFKKENSVRFSRFLLEFKKNFRNSLFFSGPIVFVLYIVFRNFGALILTNNYYKYSYLIFFILLISYMFSLLAVTGMVSMNVRNTMVYGAIIFIKKLIILIASTILLGILLKFLLLKFPVVLMFFNWIIPLGVYYSVFQKTINDKMYLKI